MVQDNPTGITEQIRKETNEKLTQQNSNLKRSQSESEIEKQSIVTKARRKFSEGMQKVAEIFKSEKKTNIEETENQVNQAKEAAFDENILRPLNFQTEKFAILLLDSEDVHQAWIGNVLNHLWGRSMFNVCIDGGANTLRYLEADLKPPNMVSGDIDRISEENMEWLRENSVEIVEIPSQNATDFIHSLLLLTSDIPLMSELDAIYAIGGPPSSSLDCASGYISTLMLATKFLEVPVYLLQPGSITVLLPSGNNKLCVSENCVGRNCGIVPLGSSSQNFKTCGIKSYMENLQMEFDDMLNTSNEVQSEEIFIHSTEPFLWIMEFHLGLDLPH